VHDPNNVVRHRPTVSGAMEQAPLGMWVHITDFWELKNEWIKQNILLDELTRMLKKGV
jgi:hypothetical protein